MASGSSQSRQGAIYARDLAAYNAKNKRSYLKRRDKVLANAKEYREANREAIAAVKLKCYNRKRNTDPGFRILCNLRGRIRWALSGKVKSARTQKLLGCTVEHLVKHLTGLFCDGMTWENYGKWELDHIKACANFDFTIEAHQRECFHWTNLQPLWKPDNIRKGKHPLSSTE